MKRNATLHGDTNEGKPQGATITTGLRVDHPRPKSLTQEKGKALKPARATAEIMRLRAAQVGDKAAAATIARCEGRWMTTREPTLVCQIEYMPSPREKDTKTFKKNVLALGEQIAERLGQIEVWANVDHELHRLNAPNERGPKPIRPGGRIVK